MIESILEIPRSFTALTEWLACLLYILMLRRRIHGWRLVGVSGLFLCLQLALLMFTKNLPIGFWIPIMILATVLMFAYIFTCTSLKAMDAVYYTVRAFVFAELAASLTWQIRWYFWKTTDQQNWTQAVGFISIYGILCALLWLLEKRHLSREMQLLVNMHELISAVTIGAVVFFLSNMGFVFANTPFTGQEPREIANVRTLVDFGGFVILYAHHILCAQVRARRELEAVQGMLINQYRQYQNSRENVEIINRVYHDLKHQITALRMEQEPEKRIKWLDEMENGIKAYETQNRTGHPVLDVLLTSKNMYCQKHQIRFNSAADGAVLQFMDTRDICSIVGNALDNAIECELKIADVDRRYIRVTVSRQKQFLLMRFENYCESVPTFDNGLPVTTKEEAFFHGYGLKNIRSIVEKYHGTMTINADQSLYDLKILIPLS